MSQKELAAVRILCHITVFVVAGNCCLAVETTLLSLDRT